MEINLRVESPSKYERVEKLKEFIGDEEVKAYSLNDKLEIVEGWGKIASDGMYNYHKNEDCSKDVMFFAEERSPNGKGLFTKKFFTLSFKEIKEIQKKNKELWMEDLETEIKRLNEL